MEKIKKFVKDHEEVVLGTIISVGGIALGTVAYRMGFKRGEFNGALKGSLSWAAMMYADRDGTLMLVEDCLDMTDEDNMKNFIDFGNEMLRSCKETRVGL